VKWFQSFFVVCLQFSCGNFNTQNTLQKERDSLLLILEADSLKKLTKFHNEGNPETLALKVNIICQATDAFKAGSYLLSHFKKNIPLWIELIQDKKRDSLLTAQNSVNYYNPTGMYYLDGIRKDCLDYAFGVVAVKALSKTKIIVNFNQHIGPPSNNIGTFYDTLIYNNRHSFYHNWEWYPSCNNCCTIAIRFTDSCLYMRQSDSEPFSFCGFGVNVYAQGYYKKISSQVPSRKELLQW
jgi:hypothetical protein